jgi:hypothetical protein
MALRASCGVLRALAQLHGLDACQHLIEGGHSHPRCFERGFEFGYSGGVEDEVRAEPGHILRGRAMVF